MKKMLLSLLGVLVLHIPAFAAGPTWHTDLLKAQAQAKAEGTLVLLNFTGSDFCSSCIRLHDEVFPGKEFAEFAQKRLVLMELDFPLKKKQPEALKKANDAIQKQFKVDGFPTLILLAADGKKLGEVEIDLFDAKAKDLVAAIEKLAAKAK